MPKKTAATAPPATLYEACLQQEQERHVRRLADIRDMKARLALLDEFVPALRAAGVAPLLAPMAAWGGKELYVRCSHMTDPVRTKKMVDTLIAAGMREVERMAYGSYDRVVLKKGRPLVSVLVDLPRQVPAAAPAVAPAAAPGGLTAGA